MLPAPDLLQVAMGSRLALGKVTSVADPLSLGRVQVGLWNLQGFPGQTLQVWARVAVPFAGPGRGAFLLPSVGDEVLIGFVEGDPSHPVVLGSLWNGSQRPPERLGRDGSRVDRWSLTTQAGTRIAIVEETGGSPQISLTTPEGVRVELSDAAGGTLTCEAQGSTITLDAQGISIFTEERLAIDAGTIEITAGRVQVNTGTAAFSSVVECNTVTTTTALAGTYMPGAGNVW
jgi:uncharacterized protein involved in type VI secretion and phage assembly